MKNYLLFIILSFQALAIPTNQTVNQLIQLSTMIDSDKAYHDGKWSCESELSPDVKFYAKDNRQDLAILKTQLLCIKHQCENIGEKVNEEFYVLKQMTNEEFTRYLESLNYSPSEIILLIKKRDELNSLPKQTCQTSSQLERNLVVDLCLVNLVTCHN